MKVVSYYNDTIQTLTLFETDTFQKIPKPELKSAEPTPLIISDDLLSKIDPTLKIPTVRWWGETFDETIFKEAVNRNTGRLSFAFPLVDIQSRMGIPIQLNAFYEDSEEVTAGALGASWKLDENFIVVDRKGTVFEELHEYYLVRGNRRARLLRDFEGSNGKVVKFSIADMKDLKIELRNEEKKLSDYANLAEEMQIPIDFEQYFLNVNADFMFIMNRAIKFEGGFFKAVPLDKDELQLKKINVNIGDKYLLSKALNETEIKTHLAQNITIRYPNYIVEQFEDNLFVIPLNDDRTTPFNLTHRTVHPASIPQLLLTKDKRGNVYERTPRAIRPNSVHSVVSMTTISGLGQPHKTRYDYLDPATLDTSVYFLKTRVIPGSSKNFQFGYFEQRTDFVNGTNDVQVFDSRKQLFDKDYLSRLEAKSRKEREEQSHEMKDDPRTVIWDKSGRFPIVRAAPFQVEDEVVGFMGFEGYEVKVAYIQHHYPISKGFRHTEERKQNGAFNVHVENKQNLLVAEYVRTEDYNNLLTTYDYDSGGNLLRVLPPNHHEHHDAYDVIDVTNSSPWEIKSEYYNNSKLLRTRQTPDTGKMEFLYDENGQLQFQLHYDDAGKLDRIKYSLYNLEGRTREFGLLDPSLKNRLRSKESFDRGNIFMRFSYGEEDPALRNRMLYVFKQNEKQVQEEVFLFDEEENLISRDEISNGDTVANRSIQFFYENEKISTIVYPTNLTVFYSHNSRGEMTSITASFGTEIASFTHDPQGKVTTILHEKENFTATYLYDIAGHLLQIKSPFLEEWISHRDGGYGANRVGDGTILRTEFRALWHDKCDQSRITLKVSDFVGEKMNYELADRCYHALKKKQVIDGLGRPVMTFYPELYDDLPIRCSTRAGGRHVARTVMSKGYPLVYGHAYKYGSHVTVELSYDYKGERTTKIVRKKSGDLLLKLHYVRDPKGNVLIELKHEYPDPKQTDKPIVTVTSYIRGPLGLIGFYRNSEYYSVLQDHEGSTRLVVKGGQVIAAYDYLPYGQLIRRFNSDPDGHITYLYTGQELDEETGLYNYHARLYDPDMGRFYQVDPQEQYPSPYKYAGNSPISLVDPDGEFAFTLFLICLGFFLAGAAHSNTFDVTKWDFKDPMLYLSMFGGVVGGLAAGMGAAASVSFFTSFFSGSSVAGHLATGTLSVAGALFGAAGASNEWNPAKWDWTSPKIWSGLFGGATVAINLPGAYLGILRTMAFLGKTVYKTTLPVLLIGFGYLGGSMANDWEFNVNKWSKGPKTFFALLDATTMSLITISTPMKLAKPVKSLTRLILHKKDLVLRAKSFEQINFGQDAFSRCMPIDWHGLPSVTCDGERSTFIYTPHDQVTVFNYLDGWIMLARNWRVARLQGTTFVALFTKLGLAIYDDSKNLKEVIVDVIMDSINMADGAGVKPIILHGVYDDRNVMFFGRDIYGEVYVEMFNSEERRIDLLVMESGFSSGVFFGVYELGGELRSVGKRLEKEIILYDMIKPTSTTLKTKATIPIGSTLGSFDKAFKKDSTLYYFNDVGLYEIDLDTKKQQLYCNEFSALRGWNQKYLDTIQFVEGEGVVFVFSGPKGIGSCQISNNSCDLKHAERNDFKKVNVVKVLKNPNPLRVVSFSKDTIQILTLSETDTIQKIPKPELKSAEPAPLTISDDLLSKIDPTLKIPTVRWWGETFDETIFKEAVNRNTGRLSFAFPLVDIQSRMGIPIQLNAFYEDSEDVTAGALGASWKLEENFIVVDRKGTVFEELHEYYLVRGNRRARLLRDFEGSNGKVVKFSIADMKDLKIELRNGEEQWVVEDKKLRYIFGNDGNREAISRISGWENWFGSTTKQVKLTSIKVFPIAWHLLKVKNIWDSSDVISYYYNVVKDGAKTTVSNLIKISDMKNHSIELVYDSNKLLTNIKIITPWYKQSLVLKYDQDYLKSINQFNRIMLGFDYYSKGGKRRQLAEVTLPSSEKVNYDYQNVAIPNEEVNLGKSKIFIGRGSYLLEAKLKDTKISIITRDLAGKNNMVEEKKFTIHYYERLNSFHAIVEEKFFLVLCYFENLLSLYVYGLEEFSMDMLKTYTAIKNQTDIHTEHNYILLRNHNNLIFFHWNENTKSWKTDSHQISNFYSIAFIDRGVVYLTIDLQLTICRWNHGMKKMVQKIGSKLHNFNKIDEIFNRIMLSDQKGEKYSSKTKANFKEKAIVVHNNVIAVRSIELTHLGLFKVSVNIYLLSKSYELASFNTITLRGDDLKSFQITLDAIFGDEPSQVTFKYRNYENERLVLYVDQVDPMPEGRIIDDFAGLAEEMLMPLDFDKYFFNVNGGFILIMNHAIRFDGDTFVAIPVDKTELQMKQFNIQIGQEYSLSKALNNVEIKLIKTKSKIILHRFEINQPQNITIRYPNYCLETFDGGLTVIPLNPDRITPYKLWNRSLHPASIPQLLLTTDQEGNVYGASARIVRFDWNNSVVTMTTISGLGNPSRTRYRYLDPAIIDTSVYYRTTHVIPGGSNDLRYGYFEQRSDMVRGTNNVQVFDSKQQLFDKDYLSRLEAKSRKQREEQSQDMKDDPWTVIWDKSRRFPIVRAAPFQVEDEVVGFMGFEDYEVTGRWVIRSDSIVKDQFSATGRNYLRLKKGERISVTFAARNYAGVFVARSCIRPTHKYDFQTLPGKMSNILSLTASDSTVKSSGVTISSNLNEWYILQVMINMTDSRNSRISLEVKAHPCEIHVDHVLYAPLDLNFEAIVYDSQTALPTEVIRNNGQVTRFINDGYGKKMVELFQNGFVKIFESYQVRSDSPYQKEFYTSSLVVKPIHGIVTPFSPYVIRGYWDFVEFEILQISQRYLKINGHIHYKIPITSDSIWLNFQYGSLDNALRIHIGSTIVYTFHRSSIPSSGHLTMLISSHFYTIWIDGSLIQSGVKVGLKMIGSKLSLAGSIVLSDIVIIDGSEFLITYHNRESNPTQETQLGSRGGIFIRQTLYDEIDRKTKQTLWTELQHTDVKHPMGYQNKFAESHDESGSLHGLVEKFNPKTSSYPYQGFFYHNVPVDVQSGVSQPGSANTTTFSVNSTVPYILLHYPTSRGFRHSEKRKLNGAIHVSVEDTRNQVVVEYTRTEDYNNVLTTYEYDELGNLLRMIPPNHHESHDKYVAGEQLESSPLDIKMEYYDSTKLLKSRQTPDFGRMEFVYNEYDQLRFLFHYGDGGKLVKIKYYLYNIEGRTQEFGLLDPKLHGELRSDPNKPFQRGDTFILFNYGEEDPALRNRMVYVFKQNENRTQEEVFLFDEEENLISRDIISNGEMVKNRSIQFNHENEKISAIHYPTNITLLCNHNSRGEITSITDHFGTKIASFTHDPQGKVASIVHEKENFTVIYSYDTAGHLLKITSPFLEEVISHQDGGYGAEPVGDGTILRTEFHALWHDKADRSQIALKPSDFISEQMSNALAAQCYRAFRKKKLIDRLGSPVKTFYPELYIDLPVNCSTGVEGNHIAEMFLTKGFPQLYGHAFKYGSHGELIEAKSYIQDERDSLTRPLNFKRFEVEFRKANIEGNATSVWDNLKKHYLISKGTNALQKGQYYETDIKLSKLGVMLNRYHLLKSPDSKENADTLCNKWMVDSDAIEKCKRDVTSYSPKVRLKLKNIDNHAKIIKILAPFFATELGKSPADVHFFSIDKNGNHKLFYVGFNRYEMKYKQFKNQIESIKISSYGKSTNFILEHNSDGNVVRADHKGISRIEYDHLVQRASKIVTSTVTVELSYDYKGERTTKIVRKKSGDLLLKLHYVRDPKGNVLIELKHEYPDPKQTDKPIVTVTSYIRGPLGLIGFYRNSAYYSVLQDHEGSTRLVVKGGQVIAAYDYLPYGQLIRRFNSDPDDHITYLYTGQELDEETGLYNYHARLYDPDLARFYQVDPQEQYPSPYKYAGNSPISLVDPDGEFAFLLFMIFLGAFLAGAAHSKTFDVTKWNFNDPMLYLSMFGGAVGGAAASMGAATSLSFFTSFFGGSTVAGVLATGTLAVAGALFGGAGAANEWNPAKWDWTSPALYSGFFRGTTFALSLPGAYLGAVKMMAMLGKTVYKTGLALLIAGFGYIGGAMANDWEFNPTKWDTGPKTLFALFDGTTIALLTASTPMKLAKPLKSLTKFITHKKDLVMRSVKVASFKALTSQTNRLAVFHVSLMVGRQAGLIKKLHQLQTSPVRAIEGRKRNKRDSYESIPSSSDRLEDVLSTIWSYLNLNSAFKSHQAPKTKTSTNLCKHKSKETKSKQFQRYCIRPTNSKLHFICPQPNSQIGVYPKANSFEEVGFGQDTFSRCMPIYWYDLPAVACEGDRSTFIYTAYDQVTVFHYLDGWIMFARVAPAICRDLKRGITNLVNVFHQKPVKNKMSQSVFSQIQQLLHSEMDEINGILEQSSQSDQIMNMWTFLKEDIEEFLDEAWYKYDSHEFEIIQERLIAFKEDITETEILHTCTSELVNVTKMTLKSLQNIVTITKNGPVDKTMFFDYLHAIMASSNTLI
ncbi:uncharacterized protein LOC6039655 [Culex quinquefasciatus]|uniref:uncharacterized protein LOC6039655 n=1 Tax=Culex quinquefasciatus TaxID=7176 RepID=UPI0018E30B95|nr:uncharacterized protein LOC6039655 [Culex quinquefasciatus]